MLRHPVTVRPVPHHAAALVARMDKRVLADFGNADPVLTIRRGIECSVYGWTALGPGRAGNEPLAIGGLVLTDGDLGRVWMVSQPGLEQHKRFFLRESRVQVAAMRALCPRLRTTIACSYPKSLRWIAWLGFTVGPEITVQGVPVREAWL